MPSLSPGGFWYPKDARTEIIGGRLDEQAEDFPGMEKWENYHYEDFYFYFILWKTLWVVYPIFNQLCLALILPCSQNSNIVHCGPSSHILQGTHSLLLAPVANISCQVIYLRWQACDRHVTILASQTRGKCAGRTLETIFSVLKGDMWQVDFTVLPPEEW